MKIHLQLSMRIVSSFLIVVLMLLGCGKESDELYSRFQDPPAEARPFVRWWWNGNRLTEQEILRELDVLKEAGIGGIEINPIAMPAEANEVGIEPLTWLTPEWNQMVKVAADGARDRRMITDMIVGTGWPFGGEFLPPEEQIKGVVLQKISLEGVQLFRGNTGDLIELKRDPADQEAPEPELLFIRLVPRQITSPDECVDLTDQVGSDGSLEFEVPDGNYSLYIGSIQTGVGFRIVTHGAPGAAGPCLDHYSSEAVNRYIIRVSENLGPVLGGTLGDALRALFVDSIELSGANWTVDLLEEFRERRGYDLKPYYPFVFYEDPYQGYDDEFTPVNDFADTLKRVRYDYNRTLTELFLERFTETYHRWCNAQNTQSRYQAYGVPWLMDMAEGYMIPDIPESNNWLFSPDAYTHGYHVWNKYTSAGAHLTGRKIASCEAMTNTRGVFQTTLDMIKRADDMNFIMGINHSVLHGFNFSPPEAGFPGWVRYGAYFSEQNTWWPYFPQWVEYNARLSAVFQEAEPVMDVAILTPRSDIWSATGLARVPIHLSPWYGHRLWEPLSQSGCSADYISERVIQEAEKAAGALEFGPMQYETLLLTDIQSLQPETARGILEFVRSGGKVVFIGSRPGRSLSLVNAAEGDSVVNSAVDLALNDYPDNTGVMESPEEGENLLAWTSRMLGRFDIEPQAGISTPDTMLYQVHHQWENRDIYFFVNHDKSRTLDFTATFPTGNKIPWRWDPASGERARFPANEENEVLRIILRPSESLLLVFEPSRKGESEPQEPVDRSEPVALTGSWEAEFQHVKEENFQLTLNALIDPAGSNDKRLNSFAGTISYRTSFEADESLPQMLDLGEVHGVSEVILNGESLGNRWWGEHLYDMNNVIKPGGNELEVRITTVLLNYMKSLTDNPTAQRWTGNQERVTVGMLGPVRLYVADAETGS